MIRIALQQHYPASQTLWVAQPCQVSQQVSHQANLAFLRDGGGCSGPKTNQQDCDYQYEVGLDLKLDGQDSTNYPFYFTTVNG